MSDREDMATEFMNQFEAGNTNTLLPVALRETHQILSCMYSRENKACYLVRDKGTEQTYILKSGKFTKKRAPLELEKERMQSLSAALPDEYICSGYWQEGETEYLLRPYIQGMNLEQYQESNHTLPLPEVLSIGIEICNSVSKLHALQPCVIHRDIKPQNIIVGNDGHIRLIDFETAREYKENQSKDTMFWGTEGNAAPEQYGFSQTDVRSDIYGIGKVLEYLYEENKDSRTWVYYPARDKQELQNIIRTATAFDPNNRYQHALQLKTAMKRLLHRIDTASPRRLYLTRIRNVATMVILIAVAFLAADKLHAQTGSNGEVNNPTPAQTEVVATEHPSAEETEEDLEEEGKPYNSFNGTVEQAAALTLGKEKLSSKDFEKITKLAVIGNQVYPIGTDIESLENIVSSHSFGQEMINGGIEDISVIAKMKNLKELFLCNQKITDITPLRGMKIEKLYLSGNQITDFSVIESMDSLTTLIIVDNPASKLPNIQKCGNLLTLNLSGNIYDNLDNLKDSTVVNLNITETSVSDKKFEVLREMKNLTFLYTGINQRECYEQISELNELEGLALWGCSAFEDLSVVKKMTRLKYLMVSGESINRMDGIESASNLESLCIDGSGITDLSLLPKLTRLRFIKINGNDIKDFSPLFQCEVLQEVSVDVSQQETIEAMEAERRFLLVEK